MVTLKFTVDHEPVAQPRQRHAVRHRKSGAAFAQNYTPFSHPVNAYKEHIQWGAIMAKGDAKIANLMTGPLVVRIVCVMDCKGNGQDGKHVEDTDVDNLAKAVLDALNGVLWKDDRQVYSLEVKKYCSRPDLSPRVCIEVTES